ncbi:ABC transporter permease [Candidatus Parcubacteria bacterium]|nr:ABC transporter permease [Candidatus Parcubacteria bacterium]
MDKDKNRHTLGYVDLFRLATRVFTVKPMRTLLTILGTSIGISTVVFLISLGYGLQYLLLGKLITTQESLITMQAIYPDGSNLLLTRDSVDDFSKTENVGEVSAVAEFPAEITLQDSPGLIVARIVDDNYFRLSGVVPDLGSAFTNDKPGIILSAHGAQLINIPVSAASLGKQVAIKIFYQDPEGVSREVNIAGTLPIVGFMTDLSQSPLAIVPNKAVSETPPVFSSVFIKAKNIDVVQSLKNALTDKGFIISARLDLINQVQKVLNVITIVLGVFGITALAVSAIGMFNTMLVSFMERTYEVGVMKSLGAMDSDVRNLFLMESLIMGLAGGVLGVLVGMGAGQICNFILNLLAQRFGGKSFTLFITPLWFIALVIITSAMIGLVAGFWPAHRASGLSPKEAFLRK